VFERRGVGDCLDCPPDGGRLRLGAAVSGSVDRSIGVGGGVGCCIRVRGGRLRDSEHEDVAEGLLTIRAEHDRRTEASGPVFIRILRAGRE